MSVRVRRVALLVVLIALLIGVGSQVTATSAASAHTPRVAVPGARAVCAAGKVGQARCFALVKTLNGKIATSVTPNGYGPADLQSAYRLPSTTAGLGQLVAIVDAYDAPTAEADLAVYRSHFGLQPCTTANGCFRKVDEQGGTQYPRTNAGWDQEISLDLDMVSASCPNCHILLVEAKTADSSALGTSVDTAARLGANVISASYGSPDSQQDSSYDSQYYKHPGIAVVVASGDSGYGQTYYPATSPFVTSVGGTALFPASNARGWIEAAWGSSLDQSGATSGCSGFEPKPSWQVDTLCPKRTVADVAAIADPEHGVAVYNTDRAPGWEVLGGTSAAAPIVAGVYALAGNESQLDGASLAYSTPAGLNDVIAGTNGTCGNYLCTSGTRYDGPTGNGTPNGTSAF